MRRSGLALLLGLMLVLPLPAQENKGATIAYLLDLQAPDGGFYPEKPKENTRPRSTLRATAAAVRALNLLGAKPRDVNGCEDFLRSCYNAKLRGFGDLPGAKPDVTSTALGILALIEMAPVPPAEVNNVVLYLTERAQSPEDIRIAAAVIEVTGATAQSTKKKVREWIKQVKETANPRGTFGEDMGAARETGSNAALLLRLGSQLPDEEMAIRVMKEGQRGDGGFGKAESPSSDLESSYRVMRAFRMLKAKPEVEALRRFVENCRNADGGYGRAPKQPSTVQDTYFAVSILRWLDEK